jgi:DNA-binding NarL/FixJ family response regulator
MRVLVADDHSLFRDGIISLLRVAGVEVVGQAGDGEAAEAAVREALRLRPDLVLMDITMPRLSGLEALRRIRDQLPDTQVVMLTVSEDDADLLDAIRSGAQGYLLKSLTANELLDMLNALQWGEAAMTRRTAAQLIKGLAEETPHPSDPTPCLTQREIELLRLVALGKSNKSIARALSVSENTVKYHLRNILHKLDAQNRTEAVTQATRSGLLDLSPCE